MAMSKKDELLSNLDALKLLVQKKTELNEGLYGKCPFHKEDTPSFHIYLTDKRIRNGDGSYKTVQRAEYHCFGCGEHGDAINFMQKTDNVSYGIAYQTLDRICRPKLTTSPPISSSPSHLGTSGTGPRMPEFCERDCERYALLREDYEVLLEENLRLREALNMGEFKPTGEDLNKREGALAMQKSVVTRLLNPESWMIDLVGDRTTLMIVASLIDSDFTNPKTAG